MMFNIYSKLTMMLAAVLLFASCSNDNEALDLSVPNHNLLAGNIVSDMTLDNGEFTLVENVIVKNGATLKINSGAVIIDATKGESNPAGSDIIIENGGKLIVNADKSNAEVFIAGEGSVGVSELYISSVGSDNKLDYTKPYYMLHGAIESDITLANGTYKLAGKVEVKSGASLTINEGVVLKAIHKTLFNDISAKIVVAQGGVLNVNGTQQNPVVFTSDTLKAGAWAGVVINGNAPVYTMSSVLYGGDNNDDSSGSIKYLRVEYASDESEGAFILNGVGKSTVIENVEVFKSSKNGFVFNGGSVNAKKLLANGISDKAYSWNKGWHGKGQFWVAYRNADEITLADWPASFIGELETDVTMPANLYPVLSNLTSVDAADGFSICVFKGNVKALLYNVIMVDGPKSAVSAWDEMVAANINDGSLDMDYVSTSNVGGFGYNSSVIIAENRFEMSANFIRNDADIMLQDGFIGSTPNGFDVSTMDDWFTSVDYKGGVSAQDDWTTGWTR